MSVGKFKTHTIKKKTNPKKSKKLTQKEAIENRYILVGWERK